jgi:hypothetical protein
LTSLFSARRRRDQAERNSDSKSQNEFHSKPPQMPSSPGEQHIFCKMPRPVRWFSHLGAKPPQLTS